MIFFALISIICVIYTSNGYCLQPSRLCSITRYATLKSSQHTVKNVMDMKLPSKLQEYVENLRQVLDDKMRYQELLFIASQAKSMPNELKVTSNKVQGCLSTVHVHATMDDVGRIYYVGDSDALLTKGLVVILVEGLSGSTVDDIINVKPDFIAYAGISNSLTPGRNNGFLNMLQLMKAKAMELSHQRSSTTASSISIDIPSDEQLSISKQHMYDDIIVDRPTYTTMMKKLSMLQPTILDVDDESYKHVGHSGISSTSRQGETHFKLRIVAKSFEGLSLVQRHKMIYTLLDQEMNNGIHALSIDAKTPSEEDSKKL